MGKQSALIRLDQTLISQHIIGIPPRKLAVSGHAISNNRPLLLFMFVIHKMFVIHWDVETASTKFTVIKPSSYRSTYCINIILLTYRQVLSYNPLIHAFSDYKQGFYVLIDLKMK